MSAVAEVRGRGRPSGATEPGRAASLQQVADELFLSGCTQARLSPKTVHDIERGALRKLRESMRTMAS